MPQQMDGSTAVATNAPTDGSHEFTDDGWTIGCFDVTPRLAHQSLPLLLLSPTPAPTIVEDAVTKPPSVINGMDADAAADHLIFPPVCL